MRRKLYASYERDFSLINLYISEHQLQSVRINYRLSLIEKPCCLYFLVASSCLYYSLPSPIIALDLWVYPIFSLYQLSIIRYASSAVL